MGPAATGTRSTHRSTSSRESRDVTDGMQKAPARAMLRAVGMTDDDWDKPQVAIAVVVERGHAVQHDAAQAGRARQGRRARGRRLPAGVRHDHRQRRHLDGPRGHARVARVSARSSPTRSRRVMHAERLDGFVGLAGCDKSIPAMLMAAARLDLPSVFVYNGSIMPGEHNGAALDITSVFEAVGACAAGTITEDELARDRTQGVPRRGRMRWHVHRQHDELDRRGHRHVACPAPRRRRRSTAGARATPSAPARPWSTCCGSASRRARS